MDDATLRLVIVEGGGDNRSTHVPDPSPPVQDSSSTDATIAAARISSSVKDLYNVVQAFSNQVSAFSKVYLQATKPIAAQTPKAITYQPAVKASPYEQLDALRKRGSVQQHEISAIYEAANLTQREIDVAQATLYENMTQEDIAERLGISQTNVSNASVSASKKLGLPQSMGRSAKADAAANREYDKVRNTPDRRRHGSPMTRTGMMIEAMEEYDEEPYEQRTTLERLSDEYMRAIEAKDTEKAASIEALMHAAEKGETEEGEAAIKAAKKARKAKREKKKHMATGGYMGRNFGYEDLYGSDPVYIPGSEMDESDFNIPMAQFVDDDETTEVPQHRAGGGHISWLPGVTSAPGRELAMGSAGGHEFTIYKDGGEFWTDVNNKRGVYVHATMEEAKANLENVIQEQLLAMGEVDWRPTETIPEDYYAMAGGGPVDASKHTLSSRKHAHHLAAALYDIAETGEIDNPALAKIASTLAEQYNKLAGDISDHLTTQFGTYDNVPGSYLGPKVDYGYYTMAGRLIAKYANDTAEEHHAHGGWLDMSRGGKIPPQDGVPSGQDWRKIYATDKEFMVNARSAQHNINALTLANANPDVKLTAHMAAGGIYAAGRVAHGLHALGLTNVVGPHGPVQPIVSPATVDALGMAGVVFAVKELTDHVRHMPEGAIRDASGTMLAPSDPNANPATFLRNIGDGSKEASNQLAKLGGAGMILGTVFGGLGETAKTLGGVIDQVNGAANKYAEYSPVLAQAKAQAEITMVLGDIRRAQQSGGELAQYIKLQAETDQKYEDVKIRLLTKLLPLASDGLKIAENLMPLVETIVGLVRGGMEPIAAIAKAVSSLLTIAQANEEAPAPMDDPTTIILQQSRVGNAEEGVRLPQA